MLCVAVACDRDAAVRITIAQDKIVREADAIDRTDIFRHASVLTCNADIGGTVKVSRGSGVRIDPAEQSSDKNILDGTVSVMACDSTDITARAKSIHNTTNVCTAALGRVLTAASMIGSMQKDDEDSITIRFAGGGPAGMVTAVAKGTGNVKGDIDNPDADVPSSLVDVKSAVDALAGEGKL